MSQLQISIAPTQSTSVPPGLGTLFADTIYSRVIAPTPSAGAATAPATVKDTVRAPLDQKLQSTVNLVDVAPNTSIDVCFLGGNGAVRLRKTLQAGAGPAVALPLTPDDVAAILTQDPRPPAAPPQIDRRAYFVSVGDVPVPFADEGLHLAPVRLADGGWKTLGLDKLFHLDSPITTALPLSPAVGDAFRSLPWTESHVGVDGRFAFSVDKSNQDAWLWWLSGPQAAVGVVLDDLSQARVTPIAVALPPFAQPSGGAAPTDRTPQAETDGELAGNPTIFTEDPGEFCRPFQNPERVLGERSFFVILRAEQPLISAEASVQIDPVPTITTVMPTTAVMSAVTERAAPPATRPPPGTVVDDSADLTFLRHTMPVPYADMLRRVDRGRTDLDASHPIQWEGDTSRYQAATAARGHILELRMRWRSNGYSLGTVAKTLTLAARQTKRIQKIEWRRSELSRRQESTKLLDVVSDTLTRDRNYDDSVQSNLSEWSHGSSESSMESGALGFGFAGDGFVIGGGGGASNASSSSSQEGGRRASASEDQRLRDSIRRYGDALRKLDSMVVSEVTQVEEATGTTEIVRNPNYGHSLTVIYYQILRHLKIETGVAGVRECLFVPFAITPFTVARAYRWRDFLQKGLRDQQYALAVRYLKDVLTNFANSDIPPGRRSDQPVRYIFGSLYIRLAIERPHDKDDGSFNPVTWSIIQPFLGSPARSIFSILKSLEETQRDLVFQKQHAPTIAAKWVDTLRLDSGGQLPADFTLATRYQFNTVSRVDFTIAVGTSGAVTRETLSSILVTATQDLPPGSVANLERLTFTYETDQFQRTVSASQGSKDLVTVATGAKESGGATIGTIPDAWERRNIRNEMIAAVQGLIEHLNQHVEYYHKMIWWNMDRDRLFMLIDGFYVPGTHQISIGSVVERDPIAIVGNAIVFRVASGSFLGIGNLTTPEELYNYYVAKQAPEEPLLVSLPTDGLYAQTVMDECAALEEHFGSTDWVLNDPDPALGEIAPELLATRRAEPQSTQPTQLPPTLINLQNAPEAPAPSGLAGALSAVTTPNAFRDMSGLAGTQANAATAFQTAANLASTFGTQAAALKLAEIASKAQDAQTADQKLATVQRAVDKKLATTDDAQRHANQILESLHAPTSTPPHKDPVLSQAVFAASGKGGSTIHSITPDGSLLVQLAQAGGGPAAAGAVAPAAAAAPAPTRLDGIDLHDDTPWPTRANLDADDIRFIIHKATDGAGHRDTEFLNRRDDARAWDIIFGSYHFFRTTAWATVSAQVDMMGDKVGRILPGELGPSVDFEHTSWSDSKAGFTGPNPWTGEQWLTHLTDFMDGIETRLGRQPMIYTSWQVWQDGVDLGAAGGVVNGNSERMGHYPLWVKFYFDPPANRYSGRVNGDPERLDPLPTPWNRWAIWQYSGDFAPAELTGLAADMDMDVFKGTIYELRGMADFGHTAPHVAGGVTFVAYTETDGRLHLLTYMGFWMDWDLLNDIAGAPLAAGDPAAAGVGDEQIIVYRSKDDGHIIELKRTVANSSAGWTMTDVTQATSSPAALDDPSIAVAGQDIHVAHWGNAPLDNHQIHLLRVGGAWHGEDMTDAASAPDASGSAAIFTNQNVRHVVARAGKDGHLHDLSRPQGTGQDDDLTATAQDDLGNAPPAATYRPAVYIPTSGAPKIVYRGVRRPLATRRIDEESGEVWQIDRDSLVATNVSVTTGSAPPAVGSPTAVFVDTAHILYRTRDGAIIHIYDDNGTFRRDTVGCDIAAAADPTAFVENGKLAVSFLAVDGTIHVARYATGRWTCEAATDPKTASGSGSGSGSGSSGGTWA